VFLTSHLVRIAAVVRTGGAEQAWAQFVQAGLAASGEPAVLLLKGRLLKERARAAVGAPRRQLFGEAAAAYRAAVRDEQDAYPLINAATLSLLAGDLGAARADAAATLSATDHDTPYYQAATRAEALLVLGRLAEARGALAEAVERGARAWEDHAVTLRQFRLILAAMGEGDGWLSILAPPRALHFTGHMALSPEDGATSEAIARLITEERVVFGYGALAAGADILVAEALLQAGAELYVILPTDPDVFRRQSVLPWGAAWVERYDRLLEAAADVQAVSGASRVSEEAIALADEAAMGMAVLRAASLSGEAIQLAVLETRQPQPAGSAATRWVGTGRRQRVIDARRLDHGGAKPALSSGEDLVAFLGCELEIPPGSAVAVLEILGRAIGEGARPMTEPSWSGRRLLLTYRTAGEAAEAADAMIGEFETGARIALSRGLAELAPNPFGPGQLAIGHGPEAVATCLEATPAGAIHLDAFFAAALALGGPASLAGRVLNLTGDVQGPYALSL
jgi:hypothetical protein